MTVKFFSNSSYDNTISLIAQGLGDRAILKAWEISITYFSIKDSLNTEKITWEECSLNKKNSLELIINPLSNDLVICEFIKKCNLIIENIEEDPTSRKDMDDASNDIEMLANKMGMLMDSKEIKELHAILRKYLRGCEFGFFKMDLNQAIEKAESNESVKRPSKVAVTLKYSTSDLPNMTRVFTYQKDLEKKCQQCEAWETTARKLLKCGKCKEVYYCNITCQKADWKSHKITCKT